MLLIGYNATTGNHPAPCEGPVGDDIDLESHKDVLESLEPLQY